MKQIVITQVPPSQISMSVFGLLTTPLIFTHNLNLAVWKGNTTIYGEMSFILKPIDSKIY